MFGRRKDDEDPFAALKDGSTYKSEPTAIAGLGSTELAPDPLNPLTAPAEPGSPPAALSTAPAPNAAQAPPPTMRPSSNQMNAAFVYGAGRTRRSSYSGSGLAVLIRVGIFLVVAAAIAIPIVSATKHVHSIKIPSFNFDTGSNPSNPSNPSAPSAPRRVSYLTPSGVRAGIAHLKHVAPGAKVALLRIDSKSFNAIVVRPHHPTKEYYFGPGVSLTTSAPAVSERPVPISAVRPSVVGKLIAEMRSRFHVPPNRIDYMVISSPPGLPTQWIVFTKAPSHPGYGATLSGAGLQKL
jgi:hypothetical protein